MRLSTSAVIAIMLGMGSVPVPQCLGSNFRTVRWIRILNTILPYASKCGPGRTSFPRRSLGYLRMRQGKAEADGRVERSLYQRAVGYSFDSVKIFMPAGAKKPLYAPYVEQRAARRRRVLTSSSRSCRCLDHSRCRMRGMNTTAVYGRYCVPKRRFADRVLVIGRLI
jgi:hypothetical protein